MIKHLYFMNFSNSDLIDSNYFLMLESAFETLNSLPNSKFISLSKAYKRLGMYWTLDPCRLSSSGKYLTFKELSRLQLTK